jgi:uncharacterized membrane protein YsdA (DUF1294 family)
MDHLPVSVIIWLIFINVVAGGFFLNDKKKAQHNSDMNMSQSYGTLYRNSEKGLHRLEAIGGVFAIICLMYIVKHKNKKESYYMWTYIIFLIWITGLSSFIFNFNIPFGHPLLILSVDQPLYIMPAGSPLLLLPFILIGLEVIGGKRRSVAQALCLLLGLTGAHKFYLGQRRIGKIYLSFFLTIAVGLIFFYKPLVNWLSPATFSNAARMIALGVGAVILGEFFLISLTSTKEFNLKYNRENETD